MNKLTVCAIVLLLAGLIMACGGKSEASVSSSDTSTTTSKEVSSVSNKKAADDKQVATNRKGRLIFKQYCVICHGADGKLAISNATDLSTSTVSMEERINQITNGKGLMTPYKDILSEEQIQSVAEYIEELRK